MGSPFNRCLLQFEERFRDPRLAYSTRAADGIRPLAVSAYILATVLWFVPRGLSCIYLLVTTTGLTNDQLGGKENDEFGVVAIN